MGDRELVESVIQGLDFGNGHQLNWIEIKGKRYYEVNNSSANNSQEGLESYCDKLFPPDESEYEFSDDDLLPEIHPKLENEARMDPYQEIRLISDDTVAVTSPAFRLLS
jgi:hypothetical protein